MSSSSSLLLSSLELSDTQSMSLTYCVRRRNKRDMKVLVFKAHRLLYHSTLDLRVIKKKKRKCAEWGGGQAWADFWVLVRSHEIQPKVGVDKRRHPPDDHLSVARFG